MHLINAAEILMTMLKSRLSWLLDPQGAIDRFFGDDWIVVWLLD